MGLVKASGPSGLAAEAPVESGLEASPRMQAVPTGGPRGSEPASFSFVIIHTLLLSPLCSYGQGHFNGIEFHRAEGFKGP